ncbi:MAG TPA: GAF domain-containing sensor histidine kinase [Streptosporangiaceae bacterium]|nr:GAF domain-containing sensor histidine kinase [Streptosporangiaceae bacterium]
MNAPDSGAGAGHAVDGRVVRDPSDQARLRQLAEEQAALRRVATLVARGTPPEQVFAAVAEEIGHLLLVDVVNMCRYDPGRTITFLASWDSTGQRQRFPVGSSLSLGGHNLGTLVYETGCSGRIESYANDSSIGAMTVEAGVRSAVGTPITVEGRLWGVISAGSSLVQPLPSDAEARLASFTELVATALANAESRAALARLAEEQAALRRVATLVARGATPEQVFAAVTEEYARLVPVDAAAIARLEPDDTLLYVASWGRAVDFLPVGSRWTLDGKNIATDVIETGRPVRVESQAGATGTLADLVRDMGVRSVVGTPVVVEGRVWGEMGAGSTLEEPLPPDAEARLASFTELVATAIANADSRAQLMASRARIVAAADETRRRIERDLHDGTQQQLVTLMLDLRLVQAEAPPELKSHLSRIAEQVTDVFNQVREISHGIHPAILAEQGLTLALQALARRSAVPVELDLRAGRRLPDRVEVAAYYAVSEALANAAKHARASAVHVELDVPDGTLRLAIRDDGIGGADPAKGSGLTGLRDRIEAVGGALDVTSPAGGGTTLLIEIPV